MKTISTRQEDRDIKITDYKENVIVDIKGNHVEITLEDNSIMVLPSVESYYKFISDANVCFGANDVFLDKLFADSNVSLVNCDLDDIIIKEVCEAKYENEDIYLLRV